MDTTTSNHVEIDFDVESAVSSLLDTTTSVGVGLYCWWKGYVQVNGRQESTADTLATMVNRDDGLDLEAIAPGVIEEGKVTRRVTRKRKAPFAAWLVQTIRGEHLSQCARTEASVLVFERHARSIMAERGVRPTDAAKVLPYAVALFFDHRSVDQIDAAAITQAAVFKTSVEEYNAKYFSWGRAATKVEA